MMEGDWTLTLGLPGGEVMALVAFLLAAGLVALGVLEARQLESKGARLGLVASRVFTVLLGLLLVLQPTWLEERIEQSPGRLAILFDVSRSMAIDEGDGSRAEVAARLAERWKDEAEARSSMVLAVENGMRAVRLPRLASSYSAEGESSEVLTSLEALARGERGEDLGAAIVVSDGAFSDAGALDRIGELGLRVHAVQVGDAIERDDAVVSVEADPVVFLRQPFEIEAKVRCIGCASRQLRANLWRGESVVEQRRVVLDDRGEGQVTFEATEQRLGRRIYRVTVPLDPADLVPENNGRSALVRVVRDRLRVLLVAGRPSWDVRFLRAFLKRDPSIDLVSFFILRTNSDLTMADSSEMALIPFPTDELFREHLGSFDIVVFQNFDYGPYRMAPYLGRVRDYVRRGGAFAMIGGGVSFASGGYAGTPVGEILPVRLVRSIEEAGISTESFRPRSSPNLRHHPLVSFVSDAEANAELWAGLSPLVGINHVAGLREGSHRLLEHPRLRTAGGEPLPVLAVGEVEEGRTLALTTDTSYRWGITTAGRSGDASAHARFWDRAIRWLSRDPTLAPTRLTTDRERYGPGARVEVSGVIRSPIYVPLSGRALSLAILSEDDEEELRVPIRTGRDGELKATIDGPTMPGAYRVAAFDPSDGARLAVEPFLVEAAGEELADPRPSPENMAKLARRTGGTFHPDPESAPSLADVDTRRERSLGFVANAPFESPFFVAFTVLAFLAEWIVRRRLGLR